MFAVACVHVLTCCEKKYFPSLIEKEIDAAGQWNKKTAKLFAADISCRNVETYLSNTSLIMAAFHLAVPVPTTAQQLLTDVNGAICNVICYICVFTAAL